MASRLKHFPVATLRFMVIAACCWGIWCSWRLARADYLFRQDTEASIRKAILVTPDAWAYYMRLAQFAPAHAQELLTRAVHLNPYNAQADIELGLQYEAEGNFTEAEHSLLDAFSVDHTYLPRWTLANYYFRRENWPAFWKWAHSAAEMPYHDIGSLFELCWRVSPDPTQITAAIANDKPDFLRQYITFLTTKHQADAVAATATRLVRYGNATTDRYGLLSVIDNLTADGDENRGVSLWHMLIERHWVVADTTLPNNADFAREPLPVIFDWRIPEYPGLYSLPGPSGLETEFSGNEPEQCTVAVQTIALSAGNYLFHYAYQTAGISSDSGIRWEIVNASSNAILAQSSYLSSEELKHTAFSFSVADSASLIDLRLIYHRAPGSSQISGTLTIQSTRIVPRLAP